MVGPSFPRVRKPEEGSLYPALHRMEREGYLFPLAERPRNLFGPTLVLITMTKSD